ncbi:hypothetical protein KCP73_09055 [Salmonella enterica subsp. enterica]|nr:hypothetical protein KCP73_09055 [Salmonella enterica subsp. enterica]
MPDEHRRAGLRLQRRRNDQSLATADPRREFNQTVKAYREALDNFRFDIAASILYEFT